jgi:hypothetical protein
MNIRGVELDQRKFYQIAIVAFSIVSVMNTATILQTYGNFILTQLISQIASNFFNYALVGFFIYLYKQMPPKYEPVTNKEMDDIMKLHEGDK